MAPRIDTAPTNVAPMSRWAIAPAMVPDMPTVDDAGPSLPERAILVIAVEGEQTSDMRIVDTGALSWREPPMSLTVNHDPEDLCGRLDFIGRTDDPASLTIDGFASEIGTTGRFVVGLAVFDLGLDTSGTLVNPEARGREIARQVAGGFLTGVSMEVGDEVLEWECVETVVDEDGFEYCDSYLMHLTEGRIGAVTVCPFQAIEGAEVVTTDDPAQALAASAHPEWWPTYDQAPTATSMTASATQLMTGWAPPVNPPAARFSIPEPTPGGLIQLEAGPVSADEFLIRQEGNHLAVPLTVTAAGEVFGHGGYWSQCHVGYRDACVSPPASATGYAHFHVGAVLTSDAGVLATGALVIGTDHAARHLRADAARDHYANTGLAWADVRAVDGVYGPWFSGSVRPDVTEAELRVIQASAMSGDWRRLGGHLEMIGLLSVNTPGFPLVREVVLASGERHPVAATPRRSVFFRDGIQETLLATAIVRPRDTGCGCGGTSHGTDMAERLGRLEAIVAAVGLDESAASALTASIGL